MRHSVVAAAVAIFVSSAAEAATPAAGYLYTSDVLSELTEGCIANAPGGVFVGVGPNLFSYPYPPPAGTRRILFVSNSGAERVVATNLNSIADCVYDPASDTLYVTDSGEEFAGSTSGDTVYAIPGDSVGANAAALTLVASGTFPNAFSIALFGDGLLVSEANGGGAGTVSEIDLSGVMPVVSSFAGGFDFTGGVVANGGSVWISESLPDFSNAIHIYNDSGTYLSTLAGPGYSAGSSDLDLDADGDVLASGSPTLVSVSGTGTATPLVTFPGFTFGGSISSFDFTGRIDFLASTFSGTDEDRSVHRLVPVESLVTGGGSETTDCNAEIYGIELVATAEGKPAKSAICYDGEACDEDGQANGSCRFPIGICLNVADSRLADCTPSAIASVELLSAKPESEALAILIDDVTALLPTDEATCVFSDGVDVPVRTLSSGAQRAGKGTIKIRTTTDEERPHKDTDVIRLVCEPVPAP